MKFPRLPGAVTLAERLSFPALLLALAVYYLHSMAGYISPLNTPDEFGYVSVAAFLSGHDWVAVARGLPWYSYGYSLLLAPVFALTAPQHWYHAAQCVNVALIVLTGICANLFLRKLDRQGPPWVRHLVVAVILLYPSLLFYAHFAWAETLIALLPWLLGWLVYRVFEEQRRYVDAFFCGCLLVASYYVHARLIVVVVAGSLVFLALSLKTGRWRELGYAVLGMIVVLVPALWFKDFLLTHLYGGAVSGAQGSILEMLASVWHTLGEPTARGNFVGSASGQLAYLVIAPLGLSVVGFVICVARLVKIWRQSDAAALAALGFVALAVVGSYALVAITMGLSPNMPQHVFYGRYTEPLVLPIVAIGLLYLFRYPRRVVWWALLAFLVACVLVPLGVQAVRRLHTVVTYWTLLTGLFTYRSVDWQLATSSLLYGFLAVSVLLALVFRLHRYAGLGLVAACFFCAGFGLLQTYASAPLSHVQKWRTLPLPPSSRARLAPQLVKLEMRPGDPAMLRTRIQLINPSWTVVPVAQWPSAFTGRYERMIWTGKVVRRSVCTVRTPGKEMCSPLDAPPVATANLKFEAGKSLGAGQALLSECLRNYLSALPYLRAVWDEVAMQHATLRYDVSSPVPYGLTVKVFVTKPSSSKWLVDKSVYQFLDAGNQMGTLRIPVPVRTYAGAALPKGFYTLHAVAVGPDGKEYADIASIPLNIH